MAVDLAGPEARYPDPLLHREAIELARSIGLHVTVHAGEWGGAAQVLRSLEINPERIAHGPHAIEDPACVAALIERGVVLDLCPTSNTQANIVESFEAFPLKRLMDAGVRVTLNTDDLTVSDVTLSQEYENAVSRLGVTRAGAVGPGPRGDRVRVLRRRHQGPAARVVPRLGRRRPGAVRPLGRVAVRARARTRSPRSTARRRSPAAGSRCPAGSAGRSPGRTSRGRCRRPAWARAISANSWSSVTGVMASLSASSGLPSPSVTVGTPSTTSTITRGGQRARAQEPEVEPVVVDAGRRPARRRGGQRLLPPLLGSPAGSIGIGRSLRRRRPERRRQQRAPGHQQRQGEGEERDGATELEHRSADAREPLLVPAAGHRAHLGTPRVASMSVEHRPGRSL